MKYSINFYLFFTIFVKGVEFQKRLECLLYCTYLVAYSDIDRNHLRVVYPYIDKTRRQQGCQHCVWKLLEVLNLHVTAGLWPAQEVSEGKRRSSRRGKGVERENLSTRFFLQNKEKILEFYGAYWLFGDAHSESHSFRDI